MPNAPTLKSGVEIPRTQWHILRDLYRNDWPKHITTVYTLQNYIDWVEKNSHWKDIRVRSIDDKWPEHGTFILEDITKLHCDVYCATLEAENTQILCNTLKLLSPEAGYTLIFCEQARLAAAQHMLSLGVPNYKDRLLPSLLYHMPKEEAIKLELRSMPGFQFKPLSVANMQQINDLWPHRYPGSLILMERLIRFNTTLGVYNESNGDLCAWILHSELGSLGVLQVVEQYKRLGLGEQLVRRLSVKLAEKGYDAIANTMENNVASSRLFQKLGFKVKDHTYWLNKDTSQVIDKLI